MKYKVIFMFAILLSSMLALESCGPVVISSRLGTPPPPWFYPNRIETVRYVYFPDHMIYYDISLRNYIYLDNGAWIRVNILPTRYKNINLRHSKFVRIKDYYADDIRQFHPRNSYVKGRRTAAKSNNRRQ